MPANLPLNGYGHIGRLALSGGDTLSYDDLKIEDKDTMTDNQSVVDDVKEALDDLRERDGETVKIYMPKDAYDRLSPEMIADRESAYRCKIVPVEKNEMQRIKDAAIVYHAAPEMPKIPEIVMYDNPHRGKLGGNKTPKIPPKDYAKKKKAKRKMQKQSRRKR